MRTAIVLVVLAATRSIAYPCMNALELEGNEAVKTMAQLEAWMDAGRYYDVESGLGNVWFVERPMALRAMDMRMLVELRVQPRRNAKQAIEYFSARVKQVPSSVKFRAWLAEAYADLGRTTDAFQILTDLKTRDLMPDAFAYVALAKVTSGDERDAALDTCKKRAKSKAICALPMPAFRARVRPSSRMRLPE